MIAPQEKLEKRLRLRINFERWASVVASRGLGVHQEGVSGETGSIDWGGGASSDGGWVIVRELNNRESKSSGVGRG